jgi:hypothetical protein
MRVGRELGRPHLSRRQGSLENVAAQHGMVFDAGKNRARSGLAQGAAFGHVT